MCTGTFTLVDVDLSGVVPPAVLEAFSEELGGRAARRAAKAAADAKAAEQEAVAERAAAAAAKGPSAAELKVCSSVRTIMSGLTCSYVRFGSEKLKIISLPG